MSDEDESLPLFGSSTVSGSKMSGRASHSASSASSLSHSSSRSSFHIHSPDRLDRHAHEHEDEEDQPLMEEAMALNMSIANSMPSTTSPPRGPHPSTPRQSLYDFVQYYIPVLGWLPQYDWSNHFLRDALSGLSVAVLLIPQAIAYASMTGLSPINGLYTAFFPSLIYFLLGSSRHMSVGPESTSAILLGHVITKSISDSDPLLSPTSEAYLQLAQDIAFKVTFLAGCVCLIMGLARTGFVDSILSQPVLEGFVCSIALLLITDQVPKLLGLPMGDLSPDAQGFEKWRHTFEHLREVHGPTAIVSLIALATLIGFKWLKRTYPHNKPLTSFPELFVVIVVSTSLSHILRLEAMGVAVLGHVPSGFQTPRVPSFTADDVSALGSSALSIAILGFVDSGIVSRIYSQKHGYFVSSNRELVALGTANMIGSSCGAFPAYGSITRTKIADLTGCVSQVCHLVATAIVGIVSIWLLPFLTAMPKAVISSMILLVAFSLLDLSSLKFLLQLGDYKDAGLYCAMVGITFFFGVDMGLLFAFLACLLMLVKQTNIPVVRMLGRTSTGEYLDLHDPLARPEKLQNILLVKLGGSLHFANCAALKTKLERMESFGDVTAHPASKPTPIWDQTTTTASMSSSSSSSSNDPSTRRSIVFDLTDSTTADSTAIHVFVEMLKHYHSRGILVVLILRNPRLQERLGLAGGDEFVSGVFRSISNGVQYAENYRQHGFTNRGADGYESFQPRQTA